MALTDKLTAIGNAIRAKTGGTEKLTLDAMPTEIESIQTGGGGDLPAEALVISGNCDYRFAKNGWNWFIEEYGDRITTNNITSLTYMFYGAYELIEIPFEINGNQGTLTDMVYMFNGCSQLMHAPKINNVTVKNLDHLFTGCHRLRNIPEDIANWFNWTKMDNAATSFGSQTTMFESCYSLRSIPMSFLSHGNPKITYYNSYFTYGFNRCSVLDELVGLPIPYTATWTSNAFTNTFVSCYRLKNITFAMPNGQPYVESWKSQTIDLSKYVGYCDSTSYILNFNSGITGDKLVSSAIEGSYEALKNDPDWYTAQVYYSRYNHDSAVATINSLPDTSAYLATAGGTNTIKFKGEAGRDTDGGAINTLTEEEIAVAAAKGWTCTFV